MKKTIALLIVAVIWLGGCSSRDPDTVAGQTTATGSGATEPGIGAANAAPEQPGQVRIFSDQPSLLTGDPNRALITAVVTDDDNRAIPGHLVSFASDGGVLQNIVEITNESGEATAQLSLAGDYRNRNITVIATVEDEAAEMLVVSQGSAITMSAPENLIIGQTADLQFTLLSGAGSPIPNQTIQFNSEAGNQFSQYSAVTDALGVASVSVSTAAGADVISAIALDGTALTSTPLTVVENVEAIVTQSRVRLISTAQQLSTGTNEVVSITTLVTDESNRVLSGKSVSFSSTGGVLQNIVGTTNEAGQATAELSLAGDLRNQDIVISAMVDELVSELTVKAEGSNFKLEGPTAIASGDEAELKIFLENGVGQPIANELVKVSSTAGNTILPESGVTDSDGMISVMVGSASGSDRILVSALDNTVTAGRELQVAVDVLTVIPQTVPYDSIPVDTYTPFSVQWTSSGIPVSNQSMRFISTAGMLRAVNSGAPGTSSVDVFTDANGIAIVEVLSTSAGPATISYSDSLDADPLSQHRVDFVATMPSRVEIEATPASVATGTASTISAVVTDAYGNPVKDIVVEFSSPDLRGGTLSPVSFVTDKDGKADISFNAGSLPTETDGIEIVGVLTDYGQVAPATTRLTVTESQLNVIIGLSGVLSEIETDTRYSKTGVIQVTDGAGRPVPDATILLGLDSLEYAYGFMAGYDEDDDDKSDRWGMVITTRCEAEDMNGNRILDPGEDSNNNGELDPRDPALVDEDTENSPTLVASQITTDSSGVGFFTLVYPQSNAGYFALEVVARVEALGTEGVATYRTGLDMSSGDADNIDVSPPNAVSPYGVGPAPAQPGCTTQILPGWYLDQYGIEE